MGWGREWIVAERLECGRDVVVVVVVVSIIIILMERLMLERGGNGSLVAEMRCRGCPGTCCIYGRRGRGGVMIRLVSWLLLLLICGVGVKGMRLVLLMDVAGLRLGLALTLRRC